MKLEDYAQQLAARVYAQSNIYAQDDGYAIDPLTILTIVSVIIKIVQFIMGYYRNAPQQAADSIKQLNFIQKWILWRYVRRNEPNKQAARYIYRSMCDLSSDLTEDERIQLFSCKG